MAKANRPAWMDLAEKLEWLKAVQKIGPKLKRTARLVAADDKAGALAEIEAIAALIDGVAGRQAERAGKPARKEPARGKPKR